MERNERGRVMVDWLIYNHYAANRGDLARKLGYNPTVLSAALTGRTPFSDKMARRLCQFNPQLNLNWLLTGEGEKTLPSKTLPPPSLEGGGCNTAERRTLPPPSLKGGSFNTAERPYPAPLKGESPSSADRQDGGYMRDSSADMQLPPSREGEGRVFRGYAAPSLQGGRGESLGALFFPDLPVSAGQVEMLSYDDSHERIVIPGVDADAYFPVIGMSMKPVVMPGDIIGVKYMDRFDHIDPDRIYLIITVDNERMIKHIMPTKPDEDYITLTSDNKDFAPFRIPKNGVLKVMRVVYVGRQM